MMKKPDYEANGVTVFSKEAKLLQENLSLRQQLEEAKKEIEHWCEAESLCMADYKKLATEAKETREQLDKAKEEISDLNLGAEAMKRQYDDLKAHNQDLKRQLNWFKEGKDKGFINKEE